MAVDYVHHHEALAGTGGGFLITGRLMEMRTPSVFEMPRRMSGESMLGPGQRYLWLCIPKNASRSIATMLGDAGAARLMESYQGPLTGEWASANLQPLYVFAFVRNPYARALSAWLNKVRPAPPSHNAAALHARHPGLRSGMDFDEFVQWLGGAYPRGQIDKHWAIQSDFICGNEGPKTDFVGRVETLEADMAALAEMTGDLGPVPRKNVTQKSEGPTEEAISRRSRDVLHSIYREDFERFGYRP
ncbi:MAG TPA: sulfotransferase family protein [Caulobacteraceae bacterium]